MDLEELKRLAYSRPADGSDPAIAQAQLAELTREIEWMPASLATPQDHLPARSALLGVAAALLLCLSAATALVLTPTDSLAIFTRAQTARDLEAPAWIAMNNGHEDTIRWLASQPNWDVYAFQTAGGNVCLTSLVYEVSAGGACTSVAEFRLNGISMTSTRRPISQTEYFTVFWGPRGEPRLYELPVDDVLRQGLESR